MIRLTQPELVHDKKEKEKDSSCPDNSTTAVKKEADVERVTSQGNDQAPSGTGSRVYVPKTDRLCCMYKPF